jgi:hypothetical protein
MAGPVGTFLAAVQSAAFGVRSLPTHALYMPSIEGPLTTGAESILLLIVLGIALAAIVVAFRRLPLAYGAYALARRSSSVPLAPPRGRRSSPSTATR